MESHPPTDQEPLTSNTEQNVDEIIIAEVSVRPLLWNQRINITKRDRRTVQQLWMEVADATNGECSVDDVKKKWKNLRDRFMKIVSLEKLPSGSGSKPSRRKWQYYDSMSFLRDTYLQKQTVSNITINESIDLINDAQEAHGDVEAEDEEVNDAVCAPIREENRKRKKDNEQDVMKQIAEALQTPRPALPTPLVLDEIDNFTSMIGCQLREILPARRRHIMLKIHQLLYTELRDNNSNNT
ncbi:uncharacterized protein LOC120357638 [Solenopsis invicta]|uniref:uncharacterized protein LOC120357638 n=1 Tax=Solenopsis invicta TaxID=13686 RepID=UPI00193DA01F|nr:uncharacterized protein LOC120357638 [Solenopsis invicta]